MDKLRIIIEKILGVISTLHVKRTGRVWDSTKHNGWGNRISYRDEYNDTWQWDGHTTPRVMVGDIISTPMESGRTANYLVYRTDYPRGVSDMWFAATKFVGYYD